MTADHAALEAIESVAFAAAVVLTSLATRAFDPRLLWRESLPDNQPRPPSP